MTKTPTQLLLVHLTDAHIKSKNSIGCQRIASLATSIGYLVEDSTSVLVLISGDIAFSGIASEYDVALDALNRLRADLIDRGALSIHIVVAPGNHDCDFEAMSIPVRAALLVSPEFDGQSPEPIIAAIEPTQSKFYQFANLASSETSSQVNQLISTTIIELAGRRIRLVALNTAITSVMHEKPGTLRIPGRMLSPISGEADLCIAIAHHPLNWFVPKDAMGVSEWIDNTADIVLHGHEHRVDDFIQTRRRVGATVNYLIGLPLEDTTHPCGFRCFRLELEDLSSIEFEARFEGSAVTAKPSESGTGSLCRNEARDKGAMHFSPAHLTFLADPGAGFTHPRINRQVELDDIFVAAEFRRIESDRATSEHVDLALTQAEICASIATEIGRTLVFGAEQSGKTTFAKKLIQEMRARRLVPLYLDAADLSSLNKGVIRGWYNSAHSSQYDAGSAGMLELVAPSERVVIIDNAQSILGGEDGIELVVDFLNGKAQRIVVLTAENPAVSILTVHGREEYMYWRSTRILELLPLGHKRRGQLIRKWVGMGRNEREDAANIEAEVRQIKKLLDRALGKSSLPKYPLFILVLLQQLEGLRANRTSIANGSHGYLFEALVSQAIERNVRSHEIGTVTDFLSSLAHLIWTRDGASVSHAAINSLLQKFKDGLVLIDGERLLKELDIARVVTAVGGTFRFRYQYLYYYYLAKWAVANCQTEIGEKFVSTLVSLVHTELSSNVLIFLAHFGEEQIVIDRIVPLLNELFADQVPCVLGERSNLSLRFRTAEQRAVLLQGPPAEVSDAHNSGLDRDAERTEESAQIEDSLKLNTILKALHVLGQVLKSRATSIDKVQMIRIAEASMLAARRLMSFAYGVIESNAEVMVRGVSEAFERAFTISKPKAVQVANSIIGVLVLAVARIGITRAADTMGSSELSPLLDELERQHGDVDSKLILLVARVIGGRHYPKEAVEDYVNSLGNANILPVGVLAAAVAQRFYLEPPERSIRDGACKLLGIDVKGVPPRQRKPTDFLAQK